MIFFGSFWCLKTKIENCNFNFAKFGSIFLDPNTFLAKFLQIPISFGNGIKFAAPI